MTQRPDFFSRRMLKFVFGALALLCAFLASFGQGPGSREALVVKVYDGDTVRLSSGEKVRLIGIDTPEEFESAKLFHDARRSGQSVETIKAQGRLAQEFTSRWLLGRNVHLVLGEERKDKYGRLLAYIYMPFPHPPLSDLPRDGFIVNIEGKRWYFINATIIQAGYAVPMTIAPNDKYRDLFQALFEQAKENHAGLWTDTGPTAPVHKRRSGRASAKGLATSAN